MVATRRRLCLEVIRLVDGRFWARVRDLDADVDCGLVPLQRAEAVVAALLHRVDPGLTVVPTAARRVDAPHAGRRRGVMTLGVSVASLLLDGTVECGKVPQVSVVRMDRAVEYGRLSLPELRFLIEALLPAQPL